MKYFFLLCFLIASSTLTAQSLAFLFKGTIDNQDLGKNESGVSISIVQNGSTISTATSASNGKYSLKGNVNYTKPFSIVFSKAGMVSKKVDFDFSILNEEDVPAGSEYQPLADLSMKLFSLKPEVDFSFLNTEPVASFEWNETKGIPDLDKVASERTKLKIEKLLLQAEQNGAANEAKYQAAIKEADNLYLVQKKYEEALAKYEQALGYKPKEKYPIDRMAELDALIQQKKEADLANQQADSQYLNAIKAADALRDQKKYDQAIAKYNEAIGMKPEQYPKDQITLIEGLKKELENQSKYLEAVKSADMFYTQKSYQAAKEKYTLANQLKPSEQHPKTRLAEIEKKLGELSVTQEKKKKYEDAILAADQLFNEEKWEEAKGKYNEALTFESSAAYPMDRIKDCDEKLLLLVKNKEKADKIAKLLLDGGVLYSASKWSEAKLKYTEVLTLDNTNAEAKQKLDEIEMKLAEAADAAAQDEKFKKLVLEGDLAAKSLKYEEAVTKYEAALKIKSDAPVQTKLDDINKKIKEIKDKDELELKFQALKAEGMKLATEKQWMEAKSKLTDAQSIKTDAAITAKLKEIEAKIQANEALVQLEKDYQDLIIAAQAKENANEIDAAILKYKEALQKKPSEQMPKDRITALEALKLNSLKQKEIDAQYSVLMAKGKTLMADQKYLESIKVFNEALVLKPTEPEPSELAAEAEVLERNKGSEDLKNYEKIISGVEKAIFDKDYTRGRELIERAKSYNKQFKIMPDDKRPDDLLLQINSIELSEKQYNEKIAEAEKQATSKNYTKAIELFGQAKSIKPTETKPQERIDEINKLIADQSTQAEKDALYKEYMTKGNLSQSAKAYEQSLSHFQNALTVKENDQIAKDKIAELQQILDNISNAAKNEIDRKNQFDALLIMADQQFNAENYLDAKGNYIKALSLDNSSLYVKKQIEECDKKQQLKNLSAADAEYALIIKTADDMFNIKSYDKAKENYNKAIGMRSKDQYPKKKLAEIDAILNPAMEKSLTLKDLGEPYDNSIMDGYAALVKADLERKGNKDVAVKKQYDDIKDAENDLTEVKKIEQQATTNQIYMIMSNITLSDEASDLNRQLTVDVLRTAEEEQEKTDIADNSYEHSENLKAQEMLSLVVEESAIDYGIRESVYSENTELLTSYNTSYAEELRKLEEAEGASNVSANQKLIRVQENLQKDIGENYGERKETENAVKAIVNKAADVEQGISEVKQIDLLTSKEEIEKIDIIISEKSQVDSKLALSNEEELKIIKNAVNESEIVQTEKQKLNSEGINETIVEINTYILDESIVRDLNRQSTTEALVQGNNSIEIATIEAYNEETVKYLKNEAIINNNANMISNIEVLADEKRDLNISSIELLDKKASNVNGEISLSDDEERLLARSSIDIINTNVEENSSVSTDKQVKNSSKLDDVNRAINAGEVSLETAQIEKHYDAQQKISTIESERLIKVKIANSLGQEYPEGVSQESFTQSDENGLMTAIITRRVVVINGQGNVYVRTQRLDNITYSKNDAPTTEYTWQKETQGPHLEKHY